MLRIPAKYLQICLVGGALTTAALGEPLQLSPTRGQQVNNPKAQGPASKASPAAPAPEAVAPGGASPVPLTVVGQKMFCDRLRGAFSNFAVKTGYNPAQTTVLASAATLGVINDFKNGRAADYISADNLASIAKVPHMNPKGSYLPLAGFVGSALGTSGNVMLALSAGELRFIPYAQRGQEMVVIAQNAASLTPERTAKVAEVAKASAIKIHVIWVGGDGEEQTAVDDARSLGWLAAMTGGVFVNLSGAEHPCASLL